MKQYSWKHVSALILGIVLTFSLLGTAIAAPGDLDPTFGTGGIVTTDFRVGGKVLTDISSGDYGNATVIQTDGKIIVAGQSHNGSDTDFSLARYNVDGTLDTNFNPTGTIPGTVMTDFGSSYDHGYAVVIQPSDGKIIVAGDTDATTTNDFALARYNTDGSLDTTFDSDGMVTTDFGGGSDYGYAVAIQTIGSVDYIVVAGKSYTGTDEDFALARYNTDGALDTAFDTDGNVTTDFGGCDYAYAVAIQTIGSVDYIVAAGSTNEEDFALVRYNSNGSLDTTFDTDGKVTTNIGGSDEAYAVALQPDGKIVAAGYTYASMSTAFALARYNSDGSLDTTGFGTGGIVTTDFGGYDYARSVVIQSGKIIAAGYTDGSGTNDFALARYNSDGTLDTSFDTDGKTTTDFGNNNWARAIAIQTDGKIVAAGYAYNGSNDDYLLARYNADGSVDTAFGKASANGSTIASSVAIQADNKIVAAGWNNDGNNDDMALARYNSNGTLDTAFATNGMATIGFSGGQSDGAYAVAIQPDQKIIIAGTGFLTWGDNLTDFALVRYNSNGTLDTTFGTGGIVTTNFSTGGWDYGTALALQTDGKIVVGGYAGGSSYDDFALARYNSNGTLDTTFGIGGLVTTNLSSGYDRIQGIAIQTDGKIVAAGYSCDGSFANGVFSLARYNTNGSLDITFDIDGMLTTSFGGLSDEASSVAIQTDGKIVAAGYTRTSANTDFALARYNSDGSLDISFDTDGKVTTDFNSNSREQIKAIAIQPSGKIAATGTTRIDYLNPQDFALALYNTDGSLDTTFGAGGKVITNVGGSYDEVRGIALQPDGKVIAAGSSNTPHTTMLALARYDVAVLPTATTNAASSVTSTGATLNGTVNANNDSSIVTFEYGLDTSYGTAVTAVQSPVIGTADTSVSAAISGLLGNTTYHFRVVAVNATGTTYGSDLTFTTPNSDTTAPTVASVTRADPSPTNLASVNFTVTFSEPVTGVDTSDFSLTTTGVSGASVGTVTGSGTTWTVPVNTGTGNGAIRLDVVNDNSIKDGVDNLLSAGFTGGEAYSVIKIVPPPTTLVNSVLPTSRSIPVGTIATIFNTVINAGANPAAGVTLSINPVPAGTFVYQQTDCATNAIIGSPNPSLDLNPGEVLCYVLSFTPSATFAATSVHIQAQAANAPSTNLLTGINTWLLRATDTLGPDIIALTTTTDFHQVSCSGANAFAVALSNVGAAATGDITVTANTGSVTLPLSISISETDPATGAVIGDNLLQNVGAGEYRTVAVFVTFNGCITFDPAVNRIFIEFRDASNNVVGSTSTAVSTGR